MHVFWCRGVAMFLAAAIIGLGSIAPAVTLTGGTGPGGFLVTGNSSDIVLWTRADSLALGNGANVDAWADVSGRGNNLGSRLDTVTFQATQADFNNLGVVQFGNGIAGDGLAGTTGSLQSAQLVPDGTHAETFWVLATPHDTNGTTNAASAQSGGFMTIGASSNHHATWQDRMIYENFSRNSRPGFDPVASLLTPHIYNVAGNDDTNWVASINGTVERSEATAGVGSPDWHGTWLYGRSVFTNTTTGDWDGRVGEIIITNRTLNDAERQIVNNYLGAKYNIGIAGDVYAGDTGGNGNFDFDVFGVGRAQGDSVTSAGAAGFGIEATGGSLDQDGEFVIAGHKLTTANGATTDNLPAQHTGERWTREWYVDSTSTNGVTLQLAFDFVNDNISSSDNAADYQLLFREDEFADYQILAATGQPVGDHVLFSDIDSSLIDGMLVTLGINVAAVPEPATIAMWSLLGLVGMAFGWRRRLAKR